MTEKVEWQAIIEIRNGTTKIIVESEDFTHDVRLYVTGDFETRKQHFEYAKTIAEKLNEKS